MTVRPYGRIQIKNCRKNEEKNYLPVINTTVITVLGKIYQWMLKLVGENMVRNKVFT